MPPPAIADLSQVDLEHVEVTREQIYSVLHHRHEFMQLDGIIHIDVARQMMIAYRDIRADEWWCKAHIPGRPIFPGVLLIESAAHVASYYYHRILGRTEFLGFSGVDRVKFRGAVTPPSRLILVGRGLEVKPRRTICEVQGFVNGTMVFEGQVTGMPI